MMKKRPHFFFGQEKLRRSLQQVGEQTCDGTRIIPAVSQTITKKFLRFIRIKSKKLIGSSFDSILCSAA